MTEESLRVTADTFAIPAPVFSDPDVTETHGFFMSAELSQEMRVVEELRRKDTSRNAAGLSMYLHQLQLMQRTVNSALVSAGQRSQMAKLMLSGFEDGVRMANDRDVAEVKSLTGGSSDEYEDEEETNSEEDAANQPAAAAPPPQPDPRIRKKEEVKKRRVEDAMLLVKEKKVRDDKGNLIPTIGPFPAPKLTVRSAKPGQLFMSRKTLTARSEFVKEEPVDDPDEFVPATQGPSGDYDVTAHLALVLKPLSQESLKKISESAKLNLKPSTTADEFVNAIVKTAARLGCEKACLLMDKHKIIDTVASYCHTSRPDIMAQLGTNVDFLTSLPPELREMLGPVLGMPKDACSVGEMWERIVAMGFCSVLTNLRQRPIRRVAQELNILLPESTSTEKFGEAIVYTAFPRERIRYKQSKNAKKNTEVQFSVLQNTVRSVGDMGFISFVVHNVSTMRRDMERHYSPEFEFGNLRWSILCMANKESLALYLCQTGTVHCKFVISVVNVNPDESLCNEGTQRFNSASAENDWGFNNVIKFDSLLDPSAGFWNAETDSITVEVGLVFVDSVKVPAANPKPKQQVPKEEQEKIIQSAADELLESERLDALRKKIKAEIIKCQKDEEKARKEFIQKYQKALSSLGETITADKNKILKAEKERDRKEQLERKKEEDRLRQIQEAIADLGRRIEDLNAENADLNQKKKVYTTEVRDIRKTIDTYKSEQAAVDSEVTALQKQADEQQKRIKKNKDRIAALKEALAQPVPTLSHDSSDSSDIEEAPRAAETAPFQNGTHSSGNTHHSKDAVPLAEIVDEHELFNNLQATLASLIGN